MNIGRLAASAAKIGMKLAGDAKVSVTLRLRTGSDAYNPATDTNEGAVTEVTVESLPFKRRNTEGPQTLVADVKLSTNTRTLLIEAAKLPAGAVVKESDEVVMGGDTWQILDAQLDPGGGAWLLDIQR